jgi:hypothetical protein
MKRRIVIIVTLFILIFITSCNNGVSEEKDQQTIIPTEKLWYANFMQFQFRIVIEGEEYSAFTIVLETVIPGEPFDPFYDELVFVHDEAEAAGLPDNVIVAWPTDRTSGVIKGLHWAVTMNEKEIGHRDWREVITFEDFGLSYPLTTEDLVNQWEKVDALWNSLTRSERSTIIHFAPRGGPAETRQLEE